MGFNGLITFIPEGGSPRLMTGQCTMHWQVQSEAWWGHYISNSVLFSVVPSAPYIMAFHRTFEFVCFGFLFGCFCFVEKGSWLFSCKKYLNSQPNREDLTCRVIKPWKKATGGCSGQVAEDIHL